VPELQFFFDESVERQDRIERILQDLTSERAERMEASQTDELSGDDERDRNEH
jgi:hypothetical protein